MTFRAQGEQVKSCRRRTPLGNISLSELLLILSSYTFIFDQALKEAATAEFGECQAKMAASIKRSDARRAHPTLEHFFQFASLQVLQTRTSANGCGLFLGEA
jgi:hypothetical protein